MNLLLLCRKHHAVVDDRRNENYYTAGLLKEWKATQESENGNPLASDDLEAIAQTNVLITAETVTLGGEGGAALGAGGGGGAAIGPNAQGGRGGDGGRVHKDGRLADASALVPWTNVLRNSPDNRPPGSGGGGAPAIGDDAVGGRGGDGGEILVGKVDLEEGTYRAIVGRRARLPGEIGGASYLARVAADGSTEPIGPKVGGALSGDSYLADGTPEIDASAIQTGVRVCCLAVVGDATIKDGAHAIGRFALGAWDVHEFPAEIVFNVLTAVTKQPEERMGYFVSLFFNGEEKARRAVGAAVREDGLLSTSFSVPIGAYFENEGRCSIVAHASGISLCETAIEIRRV
ncbi:hypothetical protein [Erythrobacter litoralis]|nr:hypothetical protein [Erythrobacter litoralis]